jgi:ribosomal-protein-alanine N-acetyltransferase
MIYHCQTAAKNKIYEHLNECSGNFVPTLEERVNLEEYVHKIYTNGVTFEAWEEDVLVGVIAAYFNGEFGYITIVSVKPSFRKQGVASKLLEMCIEYGKSRVIGIRLEVHQDNTTAIHLYEKHGFQTIKGSKLMELKLDRIA